MRIGVVIPTFNRERLVLETLESVAAQTRPPDRVVVVDDCSVDGTVDRVQEWMDTRIGATEWRVERREENGGVSAARNTGIALAGDCDLLAFLDSDDLWPPDMLEKVLASEQRNPHAAAFVVDRLIEDSTRDRQPWLERFDWIETHPIERLIRRGCPGPSCVVMRRTALEQTGGWDEDLPYMEDLDAMARLALAGPIAHVPDVAIRYRLGVGIVRGEQKAMSHSFTDRGLHRANAVERFKKAHDYPGLNFERAYCWYRAGRTAYRHGNWIECEQRCARALRLTPWYLRPAVLWLRARARRLFSSRDAGRPSQLDT